MNRGLFQIFFYDTETSNKGWKHIRAYSLTQAKNIFKDENPQCEITWINRY